MAHAIQSGWLETQINAARYRNQEQLDSGRRPLVGVNRYTIPAEEERPVTVHRIRAGRDSVAWSDALSQVETAWRERRNMVPVLMHALRARATMGELNDAMRRAHGWRGPQR